MDPVVTLGNFAAGLSWDQLAASARASLSKLALDSLGCALAGRSAPGVAVVLDQASDWGGKPEAALLGIATPRVPAPLAVLANGVLIHARDLDDTHDGAVVHGAVTALPAALAAGQARGGFGGKDLLVAFAAGLEVSYRLGLATGPRAGLVRSALCGAFGAAAAASKALGLNAEQTRNALGIVYSQAAGNRQPIADGALTKRMQPAFAAQAGTQAAFLAARGIVGAQQVFEGQFGYFALHGDERADRMVLTDALGSRFELEQTSLKPYPCCRFNHAAIQGMLTLARDCRLGADNVAYVKVQVPNLPLFDVVAQPFQPRGNLQVAAQFSIPYCLAAALVLGDLSIEAFEEPALSDPGIRGLAKRVVVEKSIEPRGPGDLVPVCVEVRTRSRSLMREEVTSIKGSPAAPLTTDEVLAKFRSCARYAGLSAEVTDSIAGLVEDLEDVDDVSQVTDALAGRAPVAAQV